MHIYIANNRLQSLKLYIKDLNKRLIYAIISVKNATIIYKKYQNALFKCKEKLT